MDKENVSSHNSSRSKGNRMTSRHSRSRVLLEQPQEASTLDAPQTTFDKNSASNAAPAPVSAPHRSSHQLPKIVASPTYDPFADSDEEQATEVGRRRTSPRRPLSSASSRSSVSFALSTLSTATSTSVTSSVPLSRNTHTLQHGNEVPRIHIGGAGGGKRGVRRASRDSWRYEAMRDVEEASALDNQVQHLLQRSESDARHGSHSVVITNSTRASSNRERKFAQSHCVQGE